MIVLYLITYIVSLWLILFDYNTNRLPIFFNSDHLFLTSFIDDMFQGNPYHAWRLPPAPYFFPDMLIHFFLRFITKDISLRMNLYIVSIQILFLGGFYYLLKTIYTNQFSIKKCFQNSLILLTIINILTLYNFPSFQFINLSAFHSGQYFIAIICISIINQMIHQTNRNYFLYTFILFALSTIGGISDKFFYLSFIFPAILSILIFLRNKKFIGVAVLLGISFILSEILYKKIIPISSIERDSYFHIHTILQMIYIMIDDFEKVFLYFSGVIIYIALGIRFAIQRLFCRNIYSSNFFFVISLFQILATLSVVIITGIYFENDVYRFRYLILVFLSPMIGFCIYISFNQTIHPYMYRILWIVLVILMSIENYQNYKNETIPKLNDFYPSSVACIDFYAKHHNFKNGISDYWNAKHITSLSKEVKVLQVLPDSLLIQHWINSSHWYKETKIDFVIENNLVTEKFKMKLNNNIKNTFQCDHLKIIVLKEKLFVELPYWYK